MGVLKKIINWKSKVLIKWHEIFKKSKITDLKFLKVFKNVENLKNHHEVGEIIKKKMGGLKNKK